MLLAPCVPTKHLQSTFSNHFLKQNYKVHKIKFFLTELFAIHCHELSFTKYHDYVLKPYISSRNFRRFQ